MNEIRFASKEYVDFLHEFPCLKCGSSEAIQAHHQISRKWLAGSDALCVPLCLSCHSKVNSRERFDCTKYWLAFLRRLKIVAPELLTQQVFEIILENEGLRTPAFTRRKNRERNVPF